MQVIYTITTLGVADILKAGPQTTEEIADKLGEHMAVGSSVSAVHFILDMFCAFRSKHCMPVARHFLRSRTPVGNLQVLLRS